MRGLRLITLAAIPVLAFSACTGSTATPAASAGTTPGAVRWFVGLGSGTQPAQIQAQKDWVAKYNKENKDGITIKLEIVPNANATDTLKTEIAAGNSPDIIGPVGVKGRAGFSGLFLDLTKVIADNKFDLKQFDPNLVSVIQLGEKGTIGIPYAMYPSYIWYNKDIFSKAGLPNLPVKAGEKYQDKVWDWNTVGDVAAGLTVDTAGKVSTDPAFDAKNIAQYGLGVQWIGDLKRIGSMFGSGNIVAADGKTAQIPPAWESGLTWYYNAIQVKHIIPDGTAAGSPLMGASNLQSSGNLAMNAAWAWSMSSIATDAATAKVKTWDMGVWPSWNGTTSAPIDLDTFVIAAATKNADKAFKAMIAIEADQTLLGNYGGVPALTSAQAAYFAAQDATLAKTFPTNGKITWSVLTEDVKVAPAISHEAAMPAYTKANDTANALLTKMQNTPGLDLTKEFTDLKAALQTIFNDATPLLNQ